MDIDAFGERAAIMEFCGGMTRFAAETAAAAEQGFKRHEVMDAIRVRYSSTARDHRPKDQRQPADDMSRVQLGAKEENRSMPERVVPA